MSTNIGDFMLTKEEARSDAASRASKGEQLTPPSPSRERARSSEPSDRCKVHKCPSTCALHTQQPISSDAVLETSKTIEQIC